MRLGLFLIACLFGIVLYFGEPDKATARQSCSGASCSGAAGCAGEARGPVRGVVRRALGIRPVRRLFGRGCNG